MDTAPHCPSRRAARRPVRRQASHSRRQVFRRLGYSAAGRGDQRPQAAAAVHRCCHIRCVAVHHRLVARRVHVSGRVCRRCHRPRQVAVAPPDCAVSQQRRTALVLADAACRRGALHRVAVHAANTGPHSRLCPAVPRSGHLGLHFLAIRAPLSIRASLDRRRIKTYTPQASLLLLLLLSLFPFPKNTTLCM
ncbi:hypothetical protein BC831DRAFT_450170 [Entophlyctis helioformis]|nr:hypothetical protein BC831DRAFT_450170 [Entophlyctis helioformis]